MKILFLDVDGVLNHAAHRDFHGFNTVHKSCVEALHFIVQQTGCKIVVSSTWRVVDIAGGTENFKRNMRVNMENAHVPTEMIDAIMDSIISSTLDLPDLNRDLEVEEWLANNEHDCFAILDDDLELFNGRLTEHIFVCHDDGAGLTWEIAERVIERLK